MVAAIVIGIALFLVAAGLHIYLVRLAFDWAQDTKAGSIVRYGGFLSAALIVHCAVAAIFAAGLGLGEWMDLGGFESQPNIGALDLFYFSLINVTTLGLGDIYPTGHLRFIAGLESLTGFLLISMAASYVFQLVRHKD
jgi:hypothetical protein